MSAVNATTIDQLKQLPPQFLAEYKGHAILNLGIAFIVVETFFFAMFVGSRFVLVNYTGIETWGFMPLGYLFGISNCVIGIRKLCPREHIQSGI